MLEKTSLSNFVLIFFYVTDAGRATSADDIADVRRGKLLQAVQAAHNVPH